MELKANTYKSFGRKSIKVIALFAIPLILNSLLGIFFTIVDSTIIGHVVPESYAGVSDVGSVYVYIALTSSCAGIGFSSVIAKYIGMGNQEKSRMVFKKSVEMSIIFGILGTLIFIFLAEPLLKLLGLNSDADYITYNSAKIYFLIVIVCFPITIINDYYLSALRGLGNSSASFIFISLASIVNILLTLIFTITFKGYEFKVFGAAIGTILSQLFCLILTRIYIYKKYPWINANKKEDFTLDDSLTRELLSAAIPLMVQYFAMAVSTFAINKSIISFDYIPNLPASTNVQVAKAVTNKITAICNCVIGGLSSSLMYFISQNIGANQLDRVKKGIKSALFLNEFVTLIFIGIVFLITRSNHIIGFLVSKSKLNDEVMLYVHCMAMTYSCCMFFKAMTDTFTQTLIGLQKPYLSVLGTFAELPFRFLIVFGLRYWLFDNPYCFNAFLLVSGAESLTWIFSAITVYLCVLFQFKNFKKGVQI